MKMKLFWTILAFALLVITACSDDDGVGDPNGLPGSWQMTALDYTLTSTTISGGQSSNSNYTGTATNMNLTITFSENPNEFTTTGDYDIRLEYTTNGYPSFITARDQLFIEAGSWEQEEDMLIVLTEQERTRQATIILLDETTLVLEYAASESTIDEASGSTVYRESEGTYTFKRK